MLRFGIVGTGVIAAWHARGINAAEGEATLAGATDVRPGAAEAFCAEFGGRAYSSYEEMLADDSVDAVCICTPSGLHAGQAVAAASAYKHALVEKPLALTVEQADSVIRAAEKSGVKVGVVSQYRFTNTYRRVKGMVEGGHLGRIVTADVFMKYLRSEEYFATSNWRGTWAMDGGGALMNQGIHGIDALLSLAGPVKSVYGLARTLRHLIEVEDTASAVLEYQSGAIGVIQGTTSVYPGFPRRLSLSGTRGTITIEEELFTEWEIEGEARPDDVILGGTQMSGASVPTNIDWQNHARHISDLVYAVEHNSSPIVSCYDARGVVEVITAIYRSSQTGTRVMLNQK